MLTRCTCIYPNSPAGYDTRSIFKWTKTSLNSELILFIDCLTKVKGSAMTYYLPIAGTKSRRIPKEH